MANSATESKPSEILSFIPSTAPPTPSATTPINSAAAGNFSENLFTALSIKSTIPFFSARNFSVTRLTPLPTPSITAPSVLLNKVLSATPKVTKIPGSVVASS